MRNFYFSKRFEIKYGKMHKSLAFEDSLYRQFVHTRIHVNQIANH